MFDCAASTVYRENMTFLIVVAHVSYTANDLLLFDIYMLLRTGVIYRERDVNKFDVKYF
jgi:hypothetical protein